MSVTETPIQALAESGFPHHLSTEGDTGTVIQLEEWLEEQIRVACKAILELLGSPRPVLDEAGKVLPRMPEKYEETAYHLLMVHDKGMFHAGDSYKRATQNSEVSEILNDWIQHFGPLFNIMCKQHQIPYEISANRVYHFQCRVVEHVQHLRRIYEQHSEGAVLASSTAWNSLKWAEPILINEDGIEFLRQSVYLPHVVGVRRSTSLVLNKDLHSRESLITRLSPLASQHPQHPKKEILDDGLGI
ncbi:MAG: hypothetical protein O3A80_05165 [bacterium]|nr:hypothetical protein [bacterium]